MSDETSYSLKKLNNALTRLQEGISAAKDQLDHDGVIQRFEFTFELLWKTLKIHLGAQGINCTTPRDCLQAAFRIGLLTDEALFLDMLKDRNKMTHLYDESEAEQIFQRICSNYASAIGNIAKYLSG